MALVSPGVQVTVTDESFFVPAAAPTVPLIFVATGAEKTQQDGSTPAAGTFESDVVRTVTSLNQSVELYGEPSFLEDSSGVALHGDARNEYGLFALNQFLGIGNRSYVVRADVNLDDDLDNIRDIWDSKFTDAATLLTTLVTNFITEFNQTNGLVSTDPTFKTSVTEAEFLSLARTATDDVWNFYSFRNSEDNYFDDHTIPGAATSGSQTASYGGRIAQGQQVINFNGYVDAPQQIVDVGNVAGQFSPGGATGLDAGSPEAGAGSPNTGVNYGFRVIIDSGLGSPLGTQEVVVEGGLAKDYPSLVTEINAQVTGAVVSITENGQLLFTRTSTATTASIQVLDGVTAAAGSPVPTDLFASLTDFVSLGTATVGGSNFTGIGDTTDIYTVNVDLDGSGAQVLTVQGQNIQTFTELVTQLNAQLVGGTFELNADGNITVVSDTSDVDTSSVSIVNVDLLDSILVVVGAGSPASLTLGAPVVDAATVGLTNPTGLTSGTTYEATVTVDGTPYNMNVIGAQAQTFDGFVDQLNLSLGRTGSPRTGGAAVATLSGGNVLITSVSTGTASTISILDAATNPAFASSNWFVQFNTAVPGTGADASLSVYANGYDQAATGTYDGLEGIAALWVANSLGIVPGEWTSDEAADTILAASDDYKFTVEFRTETSLGANAAARRAAVVEALQGAVNSNTEVRSEAFEFNLILAPGFHEVADELIALSTDIENEAFVIAETPMDLDPTQVVSWASTSARRSSPSVAYYYPHSLASNLDGKNVLAGASGTALRTYAFSDNQSEIWFAPAGTRRGLVSGVSQVGYVNTLGAFVETNLNQGQRDDLYKYFTNINPITFLQGRGIVVFGQKTSSPDASARDRVNVERLIAFVRRSLRKNLLPFVFEPNDALTRDNVKASVDNFLGDLVVRRGLFDFASVVDESNNTPDRIDRNELWVDVALQPVKAAEFIIVPIRVVATGTEI